MPGLRYSGELVAQVSFIVVLTFYNFDYWTNFNES